VSVSQNDRVLRVLKLRGEYGTTVNDWDRGEGVPAVDGGARITRLAARITDLKDAGHNVEPVEKREGFTVYALLAALPERERPEAKAVAFRLDPFAIDTTEGPVTVALEVLQPGWTVTGDGGYRQTTSEGRAA